MVVWAYLPGDAVGPRVIVRRLGEHSVNQMVISVTLWLVDHYLVMGPI